MFQMFKEGAMTALLSSIAAMMVGGLVMYAIIGAIGIVCSIIGIIMNKILN